MGEGSSTKTKSWSEAKGSANTQGTSSTNSKSKGTSNTNSKSETESENESESESESNSLQNAATYSSSESVSISCAGSMNVPPAHSVDYSMIFSAQNASIKAFADLKLTLCSAFLNPDGETDESDYIYLYNVPVAIGMREVTSCRVEFGPTEYINNNMQCNDEQQLAFSASATYLPRCNEDDNSLYESCQCDIGNNIMLGKCWCSDKFGNKLNSNFVQIEKSGQSPKDYASWNEVCEKVMKCDEVPTNNPTKSPTNNPTKSPVASDAVHDIDENEFYHYYDNMNKNEMTNKASIWLYIVFAFCIGICLYGLYAYCVNLKGDRVGVKELDELSPLINV